MSQGYEITSFPNVPDKFLAHEKNKKVIKLFSYTEWTTSFFLKFLLHLFCLVQSGRLENAIHVI